MKSFLQKHTTLVILVAILVLGTGIRLYDLGRNSFVADEFLDINSSMGYAKTGVWQSWDFNYGVPATQNLNQARDERASVYKWQVAQVLKVLPVTESSARLVSVLWGLVSMVLIFLVAKYFTKSTRVGLLATLFFALSVSAIIFDRRLRMYSMFLPVYLAFTTLLYMTLEESYKGRVKAFTVAWEKWGINLAFLPLAVLLGWLSYETHQLALTGPIVVGVYVLVMAIMNWKRGNRKNKYSILSVIGLTGVVLLFITGLWNKISYFFVFFDNHYSYFGYVFGDFAHPLLGVVVVIVGSWVLIRRSETERQGVWLTVSLFAPLAMAVWLWHRNAGPQYIFFVQSFTFILAAVTVSALMSFIENELPRYKKGLWAVILLSIILIPNYGYFFEENNTFHETNSGGNPNYRKVFTYFKKQVEPGEVLITRNFRNFYWADAQVPVYDFGGELSERNLSIADIQAIQSKHERGWVIVSENDLDYIKGDAQDYIEENMEHVNNSNVRGAIEAYKWPKTPEVKSE
jgi:4-amino-4-deoxy-L-arabinose transferase-like glycosyltransferase